MNTQDRSPLEWTGWIPCSPRDSQGSSPTPQFKSINSSVLSFRYTPTLTSIPCQSGGSHTRNGSLQGEVPVQATTSNFHKPFSKCTEKQQIGKGKKKDVGHNCDGFIRSAVWLYSEPKPQGGWFWFPHLQAGFLRAQVGAGSSVAMRWS